jgi:formylglycine-generating enzyme required for sulfatase activity
MRIDRVLVALPRLSRSGIFCPQGVHPGHDRTRPSNRVVDMITRGFQMESRLLCIAGAAVFALLTATAGAQDDAAAPEAEPAPAADEAADDGRSVRRLGDVIGGAGAEFSMDIPEIEQPAEAEAEQPDVTLPDPAMDDRLQNILARRAFVPDNPEIEAELETLLDEVEAQAYDALEAGDLQRATRLANVVDAFGDRGVVADVAAARERAAEVDRLLGQAEQALAAGTLVEPADASAWGLYQQVLALDDGNPTATQGLDAVREALLTRIDERLADSDFAEAEALLVQADERGVDPEAIESRRNRIESAREDQKRALISSARSAIDSGEFDEAESLINELISMGLDAERVARLRSSLDDAARYAGFEPGQLFQDGLQGMDAYGPVMVVLPAGSFMMGSRENEPGRVGNEGPRFRVTFERGFAMSRTEVTVGQFRRFIESTGYETDAERSGESRAYSAGSGRVTERRRVTWEDDYLGDPAADDAPVIHVSWNDARAYADWLAEQTDRPYRLPTEAEFEYALRAGSQTRYWWGDEGPDDPVENVTGDGDAFEDQRQWTAAFRRYDDGFWGPAPVGSLQANPFGLFDMGGNVMEWVADCWHDSYVRAPVDGSAWVNPGCERRVIRGASWSSTPEMSRSAFRLSSRSGATDARVGFRVARNL